MINTIGSRESERAIVLGRLYPSQEALRIGLVDELVPSAEHLNEAARKELKQWLSLPSKQRGIETWKGTGRKYYNYKLIISYYS